MQVLTFTYSVVVEFCGISNTGIVEKVVYLKLRTKLCNDGAHVFLM